MQHTRTFMQSLSYIPILGSYPRSYSNTVMMFLLDMLLVICLPLTHTILFVALYVVLFCTNNTAIRRLNKSRCLRCSLPDVPFNVCVMNLQCFSEFPNPLLTVRSLQMNSLSWNLRQMNRTKSAYPILIRGLIPIIKPRGPRQWLWVRARSPSLLLG